MISLHDVWEQLVQAHEVAQTTEGVGEVARGWRRGYRDGVLNTYVTLSGEDIKVVAERLDNTTPRKIIRLPFAP